MAATGYTPSILFNSVTTGNAPSSLVQGETAWNITDKKLWVGNASGTPIQLIGSGADATFTNLAYTGTLTGGTGIVNLGSGQFYKDASGNVGIGIAPVASTRKLLQINDSAVSYVGNMAAGMSMTQGSYFTSGANYYGVTGSPVAQLTIAGGIFYFDQAPSGTSGNVATLASGMRLDASGNLLVSKTAQDLAVAGFQVRGDAPGLAQITRSGGEALALNRLASDGSLALFYRQTSQVGSISVSTVLTTYNTTSDYRLKTVIGSVNNAGERIDALQPIEYDWNSGGRTRGFLAHQFAEVYPTSVNGEKDAVDKEGNPVYQAMQASTSEVMADLIAEIQSLRKRVAQLESK